MRILIIFLLLTSTAYANCKDDYIAYKKVKGAYGFKCVDHYDGSTKSSFYRRGK